MFYVITNVNGVIYTNERLYSEKFPIETLNKATSYCEVLVFQGFQQTGLDFLEDVLEHSDTQSTMDALVKVLEKRTTLIIPISQ